LPRCTLSLGERVDICALLAGDPSITDTGVGRRVGRHRTTIEREITENGGRGSYRALVADDRAAVLRSRPRKPLPAVAIPSKTLVETELAAGGSPAAIAHTIRGGESWEAPLAAVTDVSVAPKGLGTAFDGSLRDRLAISTNLDTSLFVINKLPDAIAKIDQARLAVQR
jgi:hypothetical protein